MSKQHKIDIPAQICWRYLKGGFDGDTNETIYTIVNSVLPNPEDTLNMIYDIAYRVGYYNSILCNSMSECTYKKTKKWIRDTLVLEIRY